MAGGAADIDRGDADRGKWPFDPAHRQAKRHACSGLEIIVAGDPRGKQEAETLEGILNVAQIGQIRLAAVFLERQGGRKYRPRHRRGLQRVKIEHSEITEGEQRRALWRSGAGGAHPGRIGLRLRRLCAVKLPITD